MLAAPNNSVSDPIGSGSVLAIALCFFLAGCALLIVGGAQLGALHAFAAFIVISAVAATNQLIPVLTRAPVVGPVPVVATGALFAVGFALLVAGFYGAPTFAAAGIVLIVAAVLWVGWTATRLLAGKAEGETRVAVAFSIVAFLGAAGVGATMAFALSGRVAAWTLALAPIHATLAILGFATVLVTTVSYRFVPMFSLAHNTAYGKCAPQWILIAAIVAVAALLYRAVPLRVALLIVFVAGVWMAMTHVRTLASRIRKHIDISLRFAIAAWSMGLLAALCAIASTWLPAFGAAAIALAILGWLCGSILGYAFKVTGFLAWQYARERTAAGTLPALRDAVNERLAGVGLVFLVIGAFGSAVAMTAQPDLARFAFFAYGIGALCTVATLFNLAFVYVRIPHVATSHG